MSCKSEHMSGVLVLLETKNVKVSRDARPVIGTDVHVSYSSRMTKIYSEPFSGDGMASTQQEKVLSCVTENFASQRRRGWKSKSGDPRVAGSM